MARASTARTEEFDLTVKSTPIDIALLQPATTQLTKLTGQLQANVHVRGTIEAPQLDGLVETTNAGFTVPATGVTYSNAIARLMFEGDRLLVDRFEVIDDGRDRLVAIGQLGIVRRSVGEMNVQISADGFKVLDNQFGDLEIEGDLRVTGDAAKPQITGEISTEAGRIEVDQLLRTTRQKSIPDRGNCRDNDGDRSKRSSRRLMPRHASTMPRPLMST